MNFVSDFMDRNVVYVHPDSFLTDVVEVMRKHGVGSVLIKDNGQFPCGIFTEHDLLERFNFQNPEEISKTKIKDVMTAEIKTVNHDELYTRVVKLMRDHNFRHLPVLENDEIVGVISVRDLMRRYEESLEHNLATSKSPILDNLAQVKRSEQVLKTIFNNSAVGIIFADNKEKITAFNPSAQEILQRDDLRGVHIKHVFPKDIWNGIRKIQMADAEANQYCDTKVKREDDAEVDIELYLSVIKDERGKSEGYIAIMRDISELKETSEKLAKSRKELEDVRAALDQHAIVAITDPEGNIIYANDKFCDISQYSREEVVGKNHNIVNSRYHPREYMRSLWATISAGKVWKGEFRNKSKDGNYFWVETTIVPFLNRAGEPYQYVSIQTNITNRKRNEEALKLANSELTRNESALRDLLRQKERTQNELLRTQKQLIQSEKMATVGNLAAGIAHQIKNPLGIILQGIERIEKNLAKIGDETNAPFVKMIKESTDRANHIVMMLLRYFRSSQVELQELNLYGLIEDAVALVENNARMTNITIEKKFGKEGKSLPGDGAMLQQVFVDLLSNSIQAMPDGGEIAVRAHYDHSAATADDEGTYVVEIEDQGVGIDEKELPKIFDPFYSTKGEGKGTGLGLSTVYLILDRHSGSIHVDSQVGRGTKFTVMLPIKSKAKAEGGA